jgi:hypothetical protein
MNNAQPLLTDETPNSQYFDKVYEAMEIAKANGIYHFLTGTIEIESIESINATVISHVEFLKSALIAQTKTDEKNETANIMRKIADDPCFAYQLRVKGDPAVNPIIGTTHSKAEGRNWRSANILLPTVVANQAITRKGGKLRPPSTPANIEHNRICAIANMPFRYISEYHFPEDPQNIVLSRNTQILDVDEIEGLVDDEVKLLSDIARYSDDDTVAQLQLKLVSTNSQAEFDRAVQRKQTRIDQSITNNAKVKSFFESVLPVAKTIASNSLEQMDWQQVLAQIEKHYVNNLQFHSDVQTFDVILDATTTVLGLKTRLQRHLARIQVMEQLRDSTARLHNRLTFAKSIEDVLLTDAAWTTKYPHPRKMTPDHKIVEMIMNCVPQHTPAYTVLHNKLVSNVDSTPEDILNTLAAHERVTGPPQQGKDGINHGIHINNVHVNHHVQDKKKSKGHGGKNTSATEHFCLLHSYNGLPSSHSTANCRQIIQGKTYLVPGEKFHRSIYTQNFFEPLKRPNLSSDNHRKIKKSRTDLAAAQPITQSPNHQTSNVSTSSLEKNLEKMADVVLSMQNRMNQILPQE